MQPNLWLPYTQMKLAPEPFKVVQAKGSQLVLDDGRTLVDGIASWWSVAHGYQHPHIIDAIKKQGEKLSHVMLGGLVHDGAQTLSTRLARITPGDLNHVFFSDSGSTAVEVALKMALQYFRNTGKVGHERFVCFSNSYHGDTFGAMSVSDPNSMHKAFKHSIIPQFCVDIPLDEYAFAEFDSLLGSISKEVAGVIIEPLVQGAGGMRFHTADVLAEIHRITKKHGLLFIADEIAVGFARTGSMFACSEAGIVPDILCLGKALTGGAVGMGATISTLDIFESFLGESIANALMHGPTFMGNPLACAAANASLDLFEREDRLKQVEAIEKQLSSELAVCEQLQKVADVRVKGAIGVVELGKGIEFDPVDFRLKAAEMGCFIRPIKNVIYLWPALTIEKNELTQLTSTIFTILEKYESKTSTAVEE